MKFKRESSVVPSRRIRVSLAAGAALCTSLLAPFVTDTAAADSPQFVDCTNSIVDRISPGDTTRPDGSPLPKGVLEVLDVYGIAGVKDTAEGPKICRPGPPIGQSPDSIETPAAEPTLNPGLPHPDDIAFGGGGSDTPEESTPSPVVMPTPTNTPVPTPTLNPEAPAPGDIAFGGGGSDTPEESTPSPAVMPTPTNTPVPTPTLNPEAPAPGDIAFGGGGSDTPEESTPSPAVMPTPTSQPAIVQTPTPTEQPEASPTAAAEPTQGAIPTSTPRPGYGDAAPGNDVAFVGGDSNNDSLTDTATAESVTTPEGDPAPPHVQGDLGFGAVETVTKTVTTQDSEGKPVVLTIPSSGFAG